MNASTEISNNNNIFIGCCNAFVLGMDFCTYLHSVRGCNHAWVLDGTFRRSKDSNISLNSVVDTLHFNEDISEYFISFFVILTLISAVITDVNLLRESIRQGPSWKNMGSVAEVRCWRSPVADRQVLVFFLRNLQPCRRS